MANWHTQSVADVLAALNTNLENGLTEAEAGERLQKHGPNALLERGARSPWRILWEQVTATMVLILLAAAVFSGVLQRSEEHTSELHSR